MGADRVREALNAATESRPPAQTSRFKPVKNPANRDAGCAATFNFAAGTII
tara:strand:- start:664 stop:816 length:153 start_codon:yes stop_codon:yes gene_type:complete